MRLHLFSLPKLAISAKFLVCLLMVATVFSEASSLKRSVRLYNSCSHSMVRVNKTTGEVNAANIDDGFDNLTIISTDFSLKLKIYSEKAEKFLCFNRRWKLRGSKTFKGDMCYFTEDMQEGYIRFRSAKDQSKMLGFLPNGRQIRARKAPNLCYNFLTLFNTDHVGDHNNKISNMRTNPGILRGAISRSLERKLTGAARNRAMQDSNRGNGAARNRPRHNGIRIRHNGFRHKNRTT